MICERCGVIAKTFMTEQHGELCEACQLNLSCSAESVGFEGRASTTKPTSRGSWFNLLAAACGLVSSGI